MSVIHGTSSKPAQLSLLHPKAPINYFQVSTDVHIGPTGNVLLINFAALNHRQPAIWPNLSALVSQPTAPAEQNGTVNTQVSIIAAANLLRFHICNTFNFLI